MSRAALQLHIDLGAADHLNLLHHAHNSNIAIATNYGGWHETVYAKNDAIQKAVQLANNNVPDCYTGQNPIKRGHSRSFSGLSCLANVFVDLDTYNVPELSGLEKQEILHRIISENPGLPMPTLFADSGRGMYLVWTFRTTKPVSFAPAWQVIENNLIDLLKPYGADPKCRDASRVLRIAETENSKTFTAAGYQQIGHPLRFEDLQKFSNTLTKAKQKAFSFANKPQHPSRVRSINTGFASTTKNIYTLAYKRMQDIRKLAELRGGRLTDLRKTALFVYGLSAAWYCHSAESIEAELQGFTADCLANAEAYAKHTPKTVLKRKQQSLEGVTVQWNGREYDPRYRMRNSTLIKLLNITPEEQKHLSCIIDKGEKAYRMNRNRTEKRRAAGVIARADYEQQAQHRKQQALELFTQGNSKAVIARTLGVTRQSVIGYLKG